MNNGTLYLAGGGEIDDSVRIDDAFFSMIPRGGRILYIPIALQRGSVGMAACEDWFSSVIASRAPDHDIDFTLFLEHDPMPDLSLFDAVYIGGGNTYHLMSVLRQREMDRLLCDYLDTGGVIYGGSAGAIVFGKSIATVKEEDAAHASADEGMNRIRGASVYCHYSSEQRVHLQKLAADIGSSILAIPENGGLKIRDGLAVEVFGSVDVYAPDGSVRSV